MTEPLNTSVTGRDDWTVGTFDIATTAGLEPHVGSVRLWFGIYRSDSGAHVLTHLPTGVMICAGRDEGSLMRTVADIKGVIDWDFADAESFARQDHSLLKEALRKHAAVIERDPNRSWGGARGQSAQEAA